MLKDERDIILFYITGKTFVSIMIAAHSFSDFVKLYAGNRHQSSTQGISHLIVFRE